MCACACACACVCVCAHMRTCARTHARTLAHTHTHTHAHAILDPWPTSSASVSDHSRPSRRGWGGTTTNVATSHRRFSIASNMNFPQERLAAHFVVFGDSAASITGMPSFVNLESATIFGRFRHTTVVPRLRLTTVSDVGRGREELLQQTHRGRGAGWKAGRGWTNQSVSREPFNPWPPLLGAHHRVVTLRAKPWPGRATNRAGGQNRTEPSLATAPTSTGVDLSAE